MNPRSDELPERPFTPTKAQLRYLNSWLDPTGPDTIVELAKAAKVNRRTVYDWFEDVQFCQWFTAVVDRHFLYDRLRMWKRCVALAISGSPDHMRLVAQRAGDLRPSEGDSGRPGPLQIFLNVPRPALQPAPPEPDTIDLSPILLPVHPSIEEQ